MKEKHRHPNHGVKMVKADYQNESDKQHWSHLRKIYRRIDDVLEERDEIHTQLEAARHIDKHVERHGGQLGNFCWGCKPVPVLGKHSGWERPAGTIAMFLR